MAVFVIMFLLGLFALSSSKPILTKESPAGFPAAESLFVRVPVDVPVVKSSEAPSRTISPSGIDGTHTIKPGIFQGDATIVNKHSSTTQTSVLFPASGDWLDVQCDGDARITDAANPPKDRFEYAKVSDAWDQMMDDWKSKDDDYPLNFGQYAWNVFHYSDQTHCDLVQDNNCGTTVECKAPAAGFLIINSLVAIHNMIFNERTALGDARDDIKADIVTFQDTFSSFPDDNLQVIKYMMDALQITWGFSSAIGWNVYDDWRAAFADMSNAAAFYGLGMGKDSLKQPTDSGELTDDLKVLVDNYYNKLRDIQRDFLANTLNAVDEANQDQLTKMVANGAMIQVDLATDNSTYGDMIIEQKKTLYGKMIPGTWALSPDSQRPFILYVDHADYNCGDDVGPVNESDLPEKDDWKLGFWIDQDTADKTSCGNSWFLLNAYGPTSCSGGGAADCSDRPKIFQSLDGGNTDTLTGEDSTWGGITLEDIIRSSYGAFVANGNKNGGYKMPDDSKLAIDDSMSQIVEDDSGVFSNSIRTAGFFQVPICLNAYAAAERVEKIFEDSDPCGEEPDASGKSTPKNDDGYAAGQCGVHITQYQRNEGDAVNPLDVFQLKLNILDANQESIGFMIKQAAEEALIVPSKLPYDLWVQVGDGDDDPICFWYSNQYWCTDNDDWGCNIGEYDSGERNGDCGFSCPNPMDDFPTTTYDLPSPAKTAYDGTSVPTSTAAPPEVTYAQGACGVHVIQYQKNENKNGLNPTDYYQVQFEVKDADNNLITTSPTSQAESGNPVTIQGDGLEYPFSVTVGDIDSDPVSFKYNDQEWDSDADQCSVGKYDTGTRNMDCGFTC
ncbi:hypothetical protein N7510_010710 [Penicillium lagena]|uniref:uncharacterized protein n=1 Tax=Penicillium lagena TaxID=94218 RepID=UPI002540D80C|nr:uncharacterized protein N7510_010710 [Penicillium lagena]KAJ5601176.1 hypothetical protein N7510_010710 [Penicillium lagena]